jgi:hypothetical protein
MAERCGLIKEVVMSDAPIMGNEQLEDAMERIAELESQLQALRDAAQLLIDSGWRERGSDWSCVDPHYLSALIELLEESGDE